MEHDEVGPERSQRDDEETHPLDADVTAVLAERPEPIPRVVARHGDEERARGGHEVVDFRVEQRVVDRKVDEVADRPDRTEFPELLPVPGGAERRPGAPALRGKRDGRTLHGRPRG